MYSKRQKIVSIVLFISIISLAGCLSTGQVLEMGHDTYSVTATATAEIFQLASQVRESAFKAGAEKCISLGKRFMLIKESSRLTRMGFDTTVTVTFRCLSENDSEYATPSIQQ
jgi:hypothetical protein